jgi:peptidoglycan/LPS O-acetylase OafA/YrhL
VKHSQALDGFRGLAILFVILFHFGFFEAGWIGVQVFFVLSGYLITSILLADRDRPAAAFFGRFYWRRSLRIFPLYFGYLILLSLVFAVTGRPVEFGERWLYLFTYTYNYALLLHPLREAVAFTHFWSLAIEEQFYLVWPFIVYWLPRRVLLIVVGAILVLSPVFRLLAVAWAQAVVPGHVTPGLYAYSPLPAQWDALTVGAGLAILRPETVARPMLWLGVSTAIALACGLANAVAAGAGPTGGTSLGYFPFGIGHYQHVWSYTVVNVWAATLLVASLNSRSISAALTTRFLRFSGRISYGLYVLHYPLLGMVKWAIFFTAYSLEGLTVFSVYLLILYAAAYLSFTYFEAPILEYKDRFFPSSPRSARSAAG